jgi:acyl-CoA thioester hydrolase
MTEYIHRVQYYETDKMGVAHHSNYIRWMEEARIAFLEEMGWGYDRMEAIGIISPVVSLRCDYKNPTTFNDCVTIRVWIQGYNGVRLTVAYEMVGPVGQIVLTGTSVHCFQNTAGSFIRMGRAFPELDRLLHQAVEKKD